MGKKKRKDKNSEPQDKLVEGVERYLSYRKKKKFIQKTRNKRKNFIEDWGGSLLWAAFVVLLINQYLFQAYQIPSGSMENTLNVRDMLFVNKIVYGPELLPGVAKLPSWNEPERGDVIIFESPEYQQKGVVQEIFNRLVYMLTFSLVNLDRDNEGNIAVHFLVKRAIGSEGDFIQFGQNSMTITPAGCDISSSFSEKKLFSDLGAKNNTTYQYSVDYYYEYNFIKSYLYFTQNPNLLAQRYDVIYSDEIAYGDQQVPKGVSIVHNPRYMAMRDHYGFYVAKDHLLPLGDNRNNSHDARSWGPVHKDKVLGQVSIRYFPFNRFGIPQ